MRIHSAFFVLASVASLAIASGCSSKEDEATPALTGWQLPPPTSGSRLRAKFLTAGEARELVGFHDTARNEDCTFQRAENGRTRCLPPKVTYQQLQVFSDAACQVPYGGTSETCATSAKYGNTAVFDGSCVMNPTALRKIQPATDARYSAGPGGCVSIPVAPQGTTATFIALGDEVPWTDFVEAEEITASADGLTERVLLGADGSRQHLGFRDPKLDVDCTFEIMGDGVARCIPAGDVGPVFYADASCSKASFVVQTNNSQPCAKTSSGLWLERPPSDAKCAATRAVYSLRDSSGSASEVPTSYARESTSSRTSPPSAVPAAETCELTSASRRYGPAFSSRGIDADITPSLLPIERIGRGSGRLVRALVARPGSRELVLGWHDTERKADCSFDIASDGKLRCLPTGASARVFSTDDACKSASRLAVMEQESCSGSTGFARLPSATCPSTTRVFSLGTEVRTITGGSTETSPGRCVKVAGVGGAYDATEVDPAQFVEGTPIVE